MAPAVSGRVVFKYQLPIGEEVRLLLPEGARVVHVDMQAPVHDAVQMWVDLPFQGSPSVPADDLELRHFEVVGTGQPFLDDGSVHRGTAVDHDAGLVWHVYEVSD